MRTQTKILLGFTALAGVLALTISRGKQYPPLETVAFVDLEKYAGTWYEIAAFPQYFEKGCICTSANYKLHPDGYVEVYNACRKNGRLKSIKGKAFVIDPQTNARLKVQFFRPFKGDYWILDLAPDYSYAVVGAPNRKYLWILARSRQMAQQLYREITARISRKGFDISRLQLTDQNCG